AVIVSVRREIAAKSGRVRARLKHHVGQSEALRAAEIDQDSLQVGTPDHHIGEAVAVQVATARQRIGHNDFGCWVGQRIAAKIESLRETKTQMNGPVAADDDELSKPAAVDTPGARWNAALKTPQAFRRA